MNRMRKYHKHFKQYCQFPILAAIHCLLTFTLYIRLMEHLYSPAIRVS